MIKNHNCDPILENPTYRAKIEIRVIGSSIFAEQNSS